MTAAWTGMRLDRAVTRIEAITVRGNKGHWKVMALEKTLRLMKKMTVSMKTNFINNSYGV